MIYTEFDNQIEHVIVREHVSFYFHRLDSSQWLLYVAIDTFDREGLFDRVRPSAVMTSLEAYYAYQNILNGGLK